MKIGIVIAITREFNSFLNSKFEVSKQIINNQEVYVTKINKNDLYVIKSGYGKIDAASATQVLISNFNCELVINYGVTGALVPGLKVEDLFIVNSTVNSDYDVSPIDPVKKHQYEEFDDIYIPLDKGMIEFVKNIKDDIKDAIVASGDKFIEKVEDKKYLASLGCNICDMEIAGIARVCYKNNVKCLSIKCISDTFEGNGGDFNNNVTKSAEKAFSLIEVILEQL